MENDYRRIKTPIQNIVWRFLYGVLTDLEKMDEMEGVLILSESGVNF